MAIIYITTTYTIEHRPYPGSRVAAEPVRMGMNYKAACEHLAMRGVEIGGRYRSVGARKHAYDPKDDASGDWHGGDDGVYRVTRIDV